MRAMYNFLHMTLHLIKEKKRFYIKKREGERLREMGQSLLYEIIEVLPQDVPRKMS